jgi:hypothetical protein
MSFASDSRVLSSPFSRWFPLFLALTLPAAQPQAGNRDDQDRAIGQTGEEERGGRIFAIQQNELSGNKRREEVGQLAENGFIAGQF